MPLEFDFPEFSYAIDEQRRVRVRASSSDDAREWARRWLPSLVARDRLDAEFDWESEIERARIESGRLALSVVREQTGSVEALMSVRTGEHSRIDERTVLYIELLAVAPWNQGDLVAPNEPELPGLGTVLLAIAGRLSRRLGMEGRLAGPPRQR